MSREQWPKLPIIYSESASAFSTRGHYEISRCRQKGRLSGHSLRISSYDHNSASCSDPADIEFA